MVGMSAPWKWSESLSTMIIHEQEKPLVVIYDHTGQPYARPKVPMGFIDPRNLQTSSPRRKT
jgi:hypothetical protein